MGCKQTHSTTGAYNSGTGKPAAAAACPTPTESATAAKTKPRATSAGSAAEASSPTATTTEPAATATAQANTATARTRPPFAGATIAAGREKVIPCVLCRLAVALIFNKGGGATHKSLCMKTVLTVTDFSASAQNALDYACAFAGENKYQVILTAIYSIPVSYAGEALSLATINDAINADEENIKEELERVRSNFPDVKIEAKIIVGGFLESLNELKNAFNPELIILGAAGDYSQLWTWNDDWLNAVISVACPVLVIPRNSSYHQYRNIAFACDYQKTCLPEQTEVIKRIKEISGARLHIVHVAPGEIPDSNRTIEEMKNAFENIMPEYHIVKDKMVIKGISEFVKEYNIDMLIVIPHEHGLWHSLFNKSYTKQLALLNDLPILAIHD
jgi:hypothetical protein